MAFSLGIYAGVIFAVYSIYFSKIIKGKPELFELEMLKSLANWMIAKGTKSQTQVWFMIIFSLILELTYFVLVLTVIGNLALQYFTWFFMGMEMIHISILSYNFYRFFHTKLVLKDIFKWKLERISALLFFTHSLLVIIHLLFPQTI